LFISILTGLLFPCARRFWILEERETGVLSSRILPVKRELFVSRFREIGSTFRCASHRLFLCLAVALLFFWQSTMTFKGRRRTGGLKTIDYWLLEYLCCLGSCLFIVYCFSDVSVRFVQGRLPFCARSHCTALMGVLIPGFL